MIDDRWSANKLKTWHRCARKFHHNYILGLGEASTPQLDFGNVGHSSLEARLLRIQSPGVERLREYGLLPDAFEQARLDAVLAGYETRWEADAATYTVLGVEVPFEFELAGHVIQGRMDAILQRKDDGRVQVMEHKFSGSDVSPGSSYFEKLALDVQISVYVDAAAALGYGDVDVLYDVVAKPKHERKLATPEADRTYTQGKGCKVCGGKARGAKGSGKRVSPVLVAVRADDVGDRPRWWCRDFDQAAIEAAKGFDPANLHTSPRHPSDVTEAALVMSDECPACGGSGWEEAPRLHANQRAEDETPDEFHDRVLADIAARPDDFYTRTIVTRTEAQKQRARASILDTIKLARLAEALDIFPMNDSACFAYNTRCQFFSACCGIDDIGDRVRFPLRSKP